MSTYRSTNSRPCASCGQASGRCLPACPDRSGPVVFPPSHDLLCSDAGNGLSVTGVMRAITEAPQSHAERRTQVPVGAVALILLGLVFVALGLVLREPVGMFIYGVTR